MIASRAGGKPDRYGLAWLGEADIVPILRASRQRITATRPRRNPNPQRSRRRPSLLNGALVRLQALPRGRANFLLLLSPQQQAFRRPPKIGATAAQRRPNDEQVRANEFAVRF
jgi:hypothetical protein